MKYAWIENDKVRDVAHSDPEEIYHPDVAKFYDTQVPDDAVNGDGWVNGVLVKPEPAPAPTSPARTWSSNDVRKNLSLAERVKWDSESSDYVKTAKIEFDNAPQVDHTTEVLQMLVDAGDITQASMAKILA